VAVASHFIIIEQHLVVCGFVDAFRKPVSAIQPFNQKVNVFDWGDQKNVPFEHGQHEILTILCDRKSKFNLLEGYVW
jgi:hypothetical protein